MNGNRMLRSWIFSVEYKTCILCLIFMVLDSILSLLSNKLLFSLNAPFSLKIFWFMFYLSLRYQGPALESCSLLGEEGLFWTSFNLKLAKMYSWLNILLNGSIFWVSHKPCKQTTWNVLIWLKYVQTFESLKEKF